MNQILPRILLVDDEPENLRALERTLRGKFQTMSFESPAEALETVKKVEFAAVVSDQKMPQMTGTDFLHQVAMLQPLACRIILTAFTETKDILDAINRAEIYRYVTKPWNNQEFVSILQHAADHYQLRKQNQILLTELAQKNEALIQKEKELEQKVKERTSQLEQANSRLSELASVDPLTKVWNRRAFETKADEEIQRSERYKHDICFAMVDVDRFKDFNDMEGHLFGDEALKKVAKTFQSMLRRTDFLARYGGEEFIIMMPETKLSNAVEICERLRHSIESATFQGKDKAAYLTVSIGLSSFPNEGKTKDHLIQAADQALYQAKQSGRNRIVSKKVRNESFFVR